MIVPSKARSYNHVSEEGQVLACRQPAMRPSILSLGSKACAFVCPLGGRICRDTLRALGPCLGQLSDYGLTGYIGALSRALLHHRDHTRRARGCIGFKELANTTREESTLHRRRALQKTPRIESSKTQ